MGNSLAQGREALRRQAWGDAYARLMAGDSRRGLGPSDLEGAALAAYLTGRDEDSQALWARAHGAWLQAGDPPRAARCAFWLALPLLLRGETARGGGWLSRAERVLHEAPSDCAERGLLLASAGLGVLRAGNPAGAEEMFGQVEEIGQRCGDRDVLAFGCLGHGQALIALGRIDPGISLLDEAMVAVTADDVSPITTGIVYCAVLVACQDNFDLARAEEWTAELSRWCDAQQDLVPFRGECMVHRAEVLQIRGEWPEAMTQARLACDRLSGGAAVGRAHYCLGELHRLRGDLTEADREYRAASAAGRSPQPGCALLRLEQGHAEAATAMIERAVATARDGATRAAVLPAYVEIALSRQAVAPARRAADDLWELAAERDTALLHATAARARGEVLVAGGDALAGLAPLEDSRRRWQELAAPYEVARARVAIALACRVLGDGDGAVMELEAARGAFTRLGAARDVERVDSLAGAERAAGAAGLTAREGEVLALLAEGRSNRDIAAALVLSPHTVRRHLQNVFAKIGVSSRTAATAYAHRHGLVPGARMARNDQ